MSTDRPDAATRPKDDPERDARFAPGLDERFGPGNWVKCYRKGCEDHYGNPSFHHRDAHVTP